MGIDAEILIRYRGETPTDDQIARWSWLMCESIGAKHFFIGDGLPPAEYNAADKRWHEAFNAHPRYPEYKALDGMRDFDRRKPVHEAIFADIGQPPKCLRRAIELTNERYPIEDDDFSDIPKTHRAPGMAWTQDGDPILAEPGETLLNVNVRTQYYGENYERGDILTICAIAEWAEVNMAPCEVWYGGDSSGVLAEPFHNERRAELRRHLYGDHGRDYFHYSRGKPNPAPKPCGLCIPGDARFNQFGSGQNYCAVSCDGCGKSFETRDHGATWSERKDKD